MTNLSSDVARIIGPWKEAILELFRPLSISGIEVTQAIQYGRAAERLTDKDDRGGDNSLTLVADKPAMVRVYVRGGLQDVPGVVGTVTVQRRRYGVWVDAGALTAIAPASVTAFQNAPYASERGSLWGSLRCAAAATAEAEAQLTPTGTPWCSAAAARRH